MKDYLSHQHQRQGCHTPSPGLAQVHLPHSEIQDLCKQECFPPEVHIPDYSQVDLDTLSVFHVSLFLKDDKRWTLQFISGYSLGYYSNVATELH